MTVGAGSTANVTVNIVAGAWRDKALYGGYIVLKPHGGGTDLRVPYVGFKGDYQSLPVLTGAGCSFPAVFQLRARRTPAPGWPVLLCSVSAPRERRSRCRERTSRFCSTT